MSSFERESFKLLQLSESGSESIPDLDLVVPVIKRQKKKVRLKRKDRDGARHSPHSGDSSWWLSSCARLVLPPNISCEPLTFCIISSFTSLILAVAALAYFTSTLHAKINYLNIQLKNVDVGSKTIPETLQMIHTRIETLRSNQSSVLTALEEINKRVDKVTKDLETVNHSLVSNKQEDIASALRSVAELGTNVQDLTHRIDNAKNKSDGNEININKINKELTQIKLNHIDLQNGGATTHAPPPDPALMEKLSGRMEVVEGSIAVLNSREDILNKTITNIDTNSTTRIDWLKEDVKNLQTKVGQLEDDNNKVLSQVGSVDEQCKSSLATVSSNMSSLSSGLHSLEALISQMKKEALVNQIKTSSSTQELEEPTIKKNKVTVNNLATEATSASPPPAKRPRDRREANYENKPLSRTEEPVGNSRIRRNVQRHSRHGPGDLRHSRSAGDLSL